MSERNPNEQSGDGADSPADGGSSDGGGDTPSEGRSARIPDHANARAFDDETRERRVGSGPDGRVVRLRKDETNRSAGVEITVFKS